jgi:hypothetical protein
MAKEKSAVMSHLGSAKSGKEKPKKHHVHRLTIERADGGGHIVHHHLKDEDGNDGPTQTHVVADNDALQENVQGAMGDQPPAGEGQPQAPPPPQNTPDPSMGQ